LDDTFYFNIISVEYIFGQTNKADLSLRCNNSSADAFTYFFKNMSFSHIFVLMDYDVVKGLILEAINLQITFIWTYNDLFVMFISTALAYRLKQITARIKSVADAKVFENDPRDNTFLIFCRQTMKSLGKTFEKTTTESVNFAEP
jgi:hypothetical protein